MNGTVEVDKPVFGRQTSVEATVQTEEVEMRNFIYKQYHHF
jgi:hypothetical protein